MKLKIVVLLVLATPVSVAYDQWSNSGGNDRRTSYSPTTGPDTARCVWTFHHPSLVGGQPILTSGRAFVARSAVPPAEEQGRPVIFALDLETGAEVWSASIPYSPGDGHAVVLGHYSRVYVTRATAERAAPIYGLDGITGAITWTSPVSVAVDPHDCVVGTDGLIVGTQEHVYRIDTVVRWSMPRTALPGGHSGPTTGWLGGSPRVNVIDAAPGGIAIKQFRMYDGLFLYQSEVLPADAVSYPLVHTWSPGYLLPISGTDPALRRLYAIEDTGSALRVRWSAPIGYSLGGESAVLSDRSVITVGPGNVLQRHAAADGAVLYRSDVIPEYPLRPTYAVDNRNIVYMATGTGDTGRLYALDSGLHEFFPPVAHPGIGGIALSRGTLVVSDTQGIYAYRNPPEPPSGCPSCYGDYDQSGSPDGDDISAFFSDWEQGAPCADGDRSGGVDHEDIGFFFERWQSGSC